MTAALPPPAPPPALEEEESASAPTFLERWLEREPKKIALTEASFMEYFTKQLLFPKHIPETALCDVGPLLGLIARHGEEAAGDDDRGDGEDGAPARTALESVRRIAAQCATHKNKAVLNHNEFQHKRSVELQEQQEHDEDDPSAAAAAIVEQPPYHPEYTPLPVPGNYLLTKIHGANYNICLAKAACPRRTQRLLDCWRGADPDWVKKMEEHGTEERVCAGEREGVERCLGLSVQRAMKEVLG